MSYLLHGSLFLLCLWVIQQLCNFPVVKDNIPAVRCKVQPEFKSVLSCLFKNLHVTLL